VWEVTTEVYVTLDRCSNVSAVVDTMTVRNLTSTVIIIAYVTIIFP